MDNTVRVKLIVCTLMAGITVSSAASNTAKPLRFSHPTEITNPYLPLSQLRQDILSGTDEGKKSRIERTRKPGTRTFLIDGHSVAAMIVEDKEFTNGTLSEITQDYFAQADEGSVYYLGEKVDVYRNGKVVDHGGAWLTGEHGAKPGILMPSHPKVGMKYRSEDVPGITQEEDEIISVDEMVTGGAYKHCVKVKEMVAGEDPEYKYYAPGVGVVEEVPSNGVVHLVSHHTE